MFLDGQRVVGAALDGCVVGDDHTFLALDEADAGDQPGGGNGLAIHAVCGELAELQKGGGRVDEGVDPVARKEFSAREMTLAGALAAALGDGLDVGMQSSDEAVDTLAIGAGLGCASVERGADYRH